MNTLVRIKTAYSSIEQMFTNRVDAIAFLKKHMADLDVVSYEIRSNL